MKAVILAGGQGSRLRPITENIPKPMVSVLGRPMMEHIIEHIKTFGVTDFLTTLHYRPRVIRDHFEDGAEFGINMNYTLETEPLGTAGSVKLGQEFLDETFIIVAGDALVDFDFSKFLEFHRKNKAKVSLCLTRVKDPGEFGIVVTDDDGKVQRFLEKPGPSEVFSDTVNTGIYLIEPDVLDQIPENTPFDFASDLFPSLLAQEVPMYGYVAEGYWSDIGTLEQLKQSHWDFLEGKVSLDVPGRLIKEDVWAGEGSNIDPEADIQGPCWIGADVTINKGARVGPYGVLTDNTEIAEHAVVNHSIVMRNTYIGENSDIRNAIIARNNVIEAGCDIRDDAVIGAGCHLGNHVVLKPGVMVWPEKTVDASSIVGENLVWESLLRPSIFGSRGVSGLANLHMTPEFAAVLAKAYGAWVKQGSTIVISRDNHPFSRVIKRALISGLMSVGVHVEDIESTSAPMTRFMTSNLPDIKGGMHVRMLSHSTSEWLVEMYDDQGIPLNRNARRKVEATYHRGDFPKVSLDRVGTLSYPGQVSERYRDQLCETIDAQHFSGVKDKVVFHSASDNGGKVLSQLLESLGISYYKISLDPKLDEQECLRELADVAKLNHAIAFYLSADVESLQIIDSNGYLMDQGRVQELLSVAFIRSADITEPALISPQQPAFVKQVAELHNRSITVSRTEPAAQLAELRAETGSHSWPEFNHYYLGFDSVVAIIKLLEFLGSQEMALGDFDRQVPSASTKQLLLPCPWEQMGKVMRELSQLPEADISSVPEGVQLNYETGPVYIVPSSDAPELQVSVEALDAAELPDFIRQISREIGRVSC